MTDKQFDKKHDETVRGFLASLAAWRCYVCGWPLAKKVEDGCVPFNCSMRYSDDTRNLAEKENWQRRATAVAALHAWAVLKDHPGAGDSGNHDTGGGRNDPDKPAGDGAVDGLPASPARPPLSAGVACSDNDNGRRGREVVNTDAAAMPNGRRQGRELHSPTSLPGADAQATPDAGSNPAAAHLSAPSGVAPIPMVLYCPACGAQHVDEPDERTPGWTNPPHRSHLCHACQCIWRPADVPTVGVEKIDTHGKADTWSPFGRCPATPHEHAPVASSASVALKTIRDCIRIDAFGDYVVMLGDPHDREDVKQRWDADLNAATDRRGVPE